MEGEVVDVEVQRQEVRVKLAASADLVTCGYDRLVFALGSELNRANIPGFAEHAFDVDTYGGAIRLNAHLQALPTRSDAPGQYTVLVAGAGLTGIEAATEMPGKLQPILAEAQATRPFRVILADHKPNIGSDMGDSARPVIEQALRSLGIETRTGISIIAIDSSGVTLASGEMIPAATVVWCACMRANPLTRLFQIEKDRVGRIPVDEFMKVRGVSNMFAAGDAAWAQVDDKRLSNVFPARPPNGPFRRPQCLLRPVRGAHVAVAHRVVRYRAGPWSLGGGLHTGMGSNHHFGW